MKKLISVLIVLSSINATATPLQDLCRAIASTAEAACYNTVSDLFTEQKSITREDARKALDKCPQLTKELMTQVTNCNGVNTK